MRHSIDAGRFGALGLPMAEAVEDCVHCGFCLPACPTYGVLQQEMDSPRGRIVLIKEVLEGELSLADAADHIDACLGCLACVTACPSGVDYGALLTGFRMTVEPERSRPVVNKVARSLLLGTIPDPARFRLAAQAGRLGKPFGRLLPEQFQAMLGLLPDRLPEPVRLQEFYPADGEERGRVALLAGCAQQVLEPGINTATIRVLTANGVSVIVPPAQQCCGALAAHTGDLAGARRSARHTLAAFPDGVDAVITNAAGCGSGLKEYRLWLRGEPEEPAAAAFGDLSLDVSVYLNRLGLRPPPAAVSDAPLRVAYHDACHLAHGQGVTAEPRELLRSLPGVELVEAAGGPACCGSAGTYNVEQPVLAAELGRLKAAAITETAPDLVVTGNIGCLTQLRAWLAAGVPAMHLMQLVAVAYGP